MLLSMVLALGRLREEDFYKFNANLGHVVKFQARLV